MPFRRATRSRRARDDLPRPRRRQADASCANFDKLVCPFMPICDPVVERARGPLRPPAHHAEVRRVAAAAIAVFLEDERLHPPERRARSESSRRPLRERRSVRAAFAALSPSSRPPGCCMAGEHGEAASGSDAVAPVAGAGLSAASGWVAGGCGVSGGVVPRGGGPVLGWVHWCGRVLRVVGVSGHAAVDAGSVRAGGGCGSAGSTRGGCGGCCRPSAVLLLVTAVVYSAIASPADIVGGGGVVQGGVPVRGELVLHSSVVGLLRRRTSTRTR